MKYYNIRHSELCKNRFLWLWSRQMIDCQVPHFFLHSLADVRGLLITTNLMYQCGISTIVLNIAVRQTSKAILLYPTMPI